ncbi:unnamed protein product [Closterium sp. NIES-64]|nr:unnamed protein product [Closterium sp. NIES-64]
MASHQQKATGHAEEARGQLGAGAEEARKATQAKMEQGRQGLSETGQQMKDTSGRAAETAREKSAQAGDVAGRKMEETKQGASEELDRAQESAQKTWEQTKESTAQATEQAKQTAGETAQRTQEAAQGTVDKTKEMASRAAESTQETGKGAAEQSRIAAEEAAAKTRETAQAAQQSVTDTVKGMGERLSEMAQSAKEALGLQAMADAAVKRSEEESNLLDFDTAAVAAVTTEEGVIEPLPDFVEKALVNSRAVYDAMYKRSLEEPEAFWSEVASHFHWNKKWETFHSYNFDTRKGPVDIKWFVGGETNLCYNAVDRHVSAGKGNKVALIWEGNDLGVQGQWTYSQLLSQVCKIANYLKSVGVKRGDTVSIYLPMVPELPAAMLACARIGAVHSVVFAGFSAESLAGRLVDSRSKVVLTATAVLRGTKLIALKSIVDDAIAQCPDDNRPTTVLVYDNKLAISREKASFVEGRDHWWQDEVEKQSEVCPVEWMEAEEPLFMLYTSGSTGKPKGVLHTTAGYMLGAATSFKYIFDHHDDDVFWCTADCGWITGHTYLTYGPLLNGATVLVFEGVPTHPDPGRCWDVVDKYKVTVFYTAPTAIRALMRCGDHWPGKYSLTSLRLLGSVGEPINPEAWRWYHSAIGRGRCPIADTWWQTETGSIMITPLAGAWALKPGSATLPFFGVEPAVLDENGNELQGACSGFLCIKRAWPSIMRTVKGDHARFEEVYFSMFKGYYFTGDGCRRDEDGFYWVTGRVDDVINVSGHRIGTAEVESALVAHESCAEAAVVGYEHPIKGQGIYAFVTLMEGVEQTEEVRTALKSAVRQAIGAFATPDVIHWAPGLPKTRSGKIMRRVLRKIAANDLETLGDISTLADPSVVQQLIELRGV